MVNDERMITRRICTTGVMIALGVVLSLFSQQLLVFGDIRLDLSYIVIVLLCYMYGPITGAISAMGMAALNSCMFGAFGFSLSWTMANMFIGFSVGLVMTLTRKMESTHKIPWLIINIVTIVISVAIGMLVIKTGIEVALFGVQYGLSWITELPGNAIAFAMDTVTCLVGFLAILPKTSKQIMKHLGA